MTNYYFDMDGVLANFHEHKDGWKMSGNYNFIRNPRPFTEAVNLVNALTEAEGVEVFISSLCRNEYAKRAKLAWLHQYCPNLKTENIIILIGHARKVDNMMTDDGILVDDKEANIKQWRKSGHKAIFVEIKGQVDLTIAQ